MRRINSEFQTRYMSEEGQKLSNRDYFGYVEMDDFACYVLADSLDGDLEANSARFAVESLIRSFTEHPSMGKRNLLRFMQTAHKELLKEHKGMHLKASVNMIVTDYKKIRYCYVGNSRFYLIRNNRYLVQTADQSLTQNMVREEKIPLDQAAVHEERNNLYSYLGERGQPDIQISPKIKVEDGDILAQLTRGLWERCSDEELMNAVKDAKEPGDILDRVEDVILGQQEEKAWGSIDNYSLAVTFIQKVYQNPKKRLSLKQILMIAIPVLLVAGGISLGFYLRHRSVKNKEQNLSQHMDSGETYLRYDNYKKAAEDYTEAKKLANSLKKKKELSEADQYLKLSDQILLADEAMTAGEYKKAQELYLGARELSVQAGNVGKKYIDQQLEQTRAYIDVYDLIRLGEEKEAYGDMEGAIASYRQARDKAAALYYAAGKDEALSKQASAEQKAETADQKEKAAEAAAKKEAQEAQEKEAAAIKESEEAQLELENQQKLNDQKNAIDLENKGNELLADGQYESAITYYRTAQSIYTRLELYELADALNDKIRAANAGITAEEASLNQRQAEPGDHL
ncbi:MAG: hypothetical protein QM657_02560 [Lacrimispora sp.]|uniref:PP2C family protein-serine/threonine phosphatase n=1 Tax=Lacrimispora sp. TaxID=2719234 RepID=UPI0039E5F901